MSSQQKRTWQDRCKAPFQRPKRTWLLVGAVTLIAIGLVLFLSGPKVSIQKPTRKEIVQKVLATGRVVPVGRVNLGCLIGGTAKHVNVQEGDKVRKGDVLLQLDNDDSMAAYELAQANLAQAQARMQQLTQVQAKVSSQSVRQAEVNLEQARLDFNRQSALLTQNATSRESYDRAKQALDIAASNVASSRVTEKSYDSRGADRRFAQTAIAQAEANLQSARAQLDKTRIVAPEDGIILTRKVEPGDLVQPGATLFTMARGGFVRVYVDVDEKYLSYLKPGQWATVIPDAFPKHSFPARLYFIGPEINESNGTVEARFEIPNPPDFLKADLSISIQIEVARKQNALILPLTLIRDLGTPSPWVLVARNSRAEKQPVTIGLQGEDVAEIAQGLSEHDSVIPPQEKVTPGKRVRVISTPKEAAYAL